MTDPRPSTLLAPYLAPGRLARMQAVLDQRTRHLTALLEQVHDPHNLAACARTADTLGLQDLHGIPEDQTRPPDLGRAVSLKAERWLTMHLHPSLHDALPALVGYTLVAAAPDGELPLTELDALPLDRPLVLAFGNERRGLSPELLARASHRVAFPMRGFSGSLNVSVAFALVMAHLRARLERELPPERWRLPPASREALLDEWVHRDVAHADAILRELARRG